MASAAKPNLANFGDGLANNSNNGWKPNSIRKANHTVKRARIASRSANTHSSKLVTAAVNFAGEIDVRDLEIGQKYQFRNRYGELTREGTYAGHDEGHPTHIILTNYYEYFKRSDGEIIKRRGQDPVSRMAITEFMHIYPKTYEKIYGVGIKYGLPSDAAGHVRSFLRSKPSSKTRNLHGGKRRRTKRKY
jgi:hypothetical protein